MDQTPDHRSETAGPNRSTRSVLRVILFRSKKIIERRVPESWRSRSRTVGFRATDERLRRLDREAIESRQARFLGEITESEGVGDLTAENTGIPETGIGRQGSISSFVILASFAVEISHFFSGWATSLSITCFSLSCPAASAGSAFSWTAGRRCSQIMSSSPCMLPVSAVMETTMS
jgi:hypothetical protein